MQLPIAPSSYYEHQARERDARRLPRRHRLDAALREDVKRVYRQRRRRYGACEVWRQLKREGVSGARCTVERLMRVEGLQGVSRDGFKRTSIADKRATPPADLVNPDFRVRRPNALWVSDLTYVRTRHGFGVYTALVLNAHSRRIVGWRVSRTLHANLVCSTPWSRRCTPATAANRW